MLFQEKLFYALVCLILTVSSGFLIDPMLKVIVSTKVTSNPPKGIRASDWNSLLGIEEMGSFREGSFGGMWIGILERALFFTAFWIGSIALIFGWLAFKVASKWEVWGNVTRVPEKIPNVKPIEYFVARKHWAVRTHQRFVIGTLLNLIVAMMGFGLYYLAVHPNILFR